MMDTSRIQKKEWGKKINGAKRQDDKSNVGVGIRWTAYNAEENVNSFISSKCPNKDCKYKDAFTPETSD